MTVQIDVDIADPAWRDSVADVKDLCQRAAGAVLAGRVREAAELSLVLADDETVRTLNRTYRDRDAPTNVLSFPAEERFAGTGPRLLGDVVLARGTVEREATAGNLEIRDHLAHLVIHGTLHLLGYDHQSDDEAEIMERTEAAILAELGIADPYAVPHGGV